MSVVRVMNPAEAFALAHHAKQMYRPGVPYAYHLGYVVDVLERFGVTDPSTVAIAWLHDVLEDTGAGMLQLMDAFGDDIAEAVWTITEPKLDTRAKKHAYTYPKIVKHERLRLVKLADRIANVEAGGPKVEMYRKEHPAFVAALKVGNASPMELAMWAHLGILLATSEGA